MSPVARQAHLSLLRSHFISSEMARRCCSILAWCVRCRRLLAPPTLTRLPSLAGQSEAFLDAYPFWGPLFAAITVLLAMLIDYMLRLWLERSAKRLAEEGRSLDDKDPADGEIPAGSDEKDFAWSHDHESDCHNASLIQSKEAMLRYKRGVIAFVEVSVLTHSIPVGLALGLQRGSAFTGLFIAVMFHQLIEGFGVGAATIEGRYNRFTEVMLATAFAITTPIGISIGIILQMTLSTVSTGYIITVGTCNSVGAGLLLYIGIEHLNALRSRGGWLRQQDWKAQTVALGSFVVGGAAMFVICKYS